MPDIGEHVICHMDEHSEAGVILGAIYSDSDTPPVSSQDKCHMLFEDGTSIEYDRSSHTLTIDVKGDATIKASGAMVALVSSGVSITASGPVSVAGSGAMTLQSTGSISIAAPSVNFSGTVSGVGH